MNDDWIQERLRELRESMAPMNAPESVQAAVLGAFRERARSRRHVRRLWRWAVAACLAMLSIVGAWRLLRPEQPSVAIADPPRPPAPPASSPRVAREAQVAAASHTGTGKLNRAHKRATERTAMQRPRRKPATAEPETTAAFVPLPFAPPLTPAEDQQVVRVRMPRGAMRQFGMFVREDRVRDPVQADFLLGQDGIARAVRLVNNAQ
ncbi:MAG TPA: hypothetical protein VFL57_04905 [Bryobacteraceae bacterium]|nr:hypothetical protein [Bryobacteraceae bacterium]